MRHRLTRFIRSGAPFDLLGLAGLAALSFGIWQISEPAAFIVGGLVAAGFAYFLSPPSSGRNRS